MSRFWLKPIGTTNRGWPDRPYDLPHVAFRRRNPTGVHSGDGLILYAVGGWKCIFGVAQVTTEPSDHGEKEEWRWRAKFQLQTSVKPSDGVPIGEIDASGRNLLPAIQRGNGYVSLTKEEYDQAVAKLRRAFTK